MTMNDVILRPTLDLPHNYPLSKLFFINFARFVWTITHCSVINLNLKIVGVIFLTTLGKVKIDFMNTLMGVF